MTNNLKTPYVIIGHELAGNYIQAILKRFQISTFVYVYAFEGALPIIAEIKELLYPFGIVEIRRRYTVEIPSTKNPDKNITRYEIMLEIDVKVLQYLTLLNFRPSEKDEPKSYEDYSALFQEFKKIFKKKKK